MRWVPRWATGQAGPGPPGAGLAGAGLAGARLLAWGGIAGPVLFTAAWVAGSLRQAGHSAVTVQISGLAAMNARNPQIMMAGFVALGACSVAWGVALGRVQAAGSAGPWLVKVGGAAAIAAGLFRRDHLLLVGPGFAGESWHNQVHDVVSGVAYGAMIAVPLVLARRFRRDPDWAALSRPLQVLALVSGAVLALFASRAADSWNGTLQRVAVTLPLAAEALIAAWMLTHGPATPASATAAGSATGPGRDRRPTPARSIQVPARVRVIAAPSHARIGS